MMSPPDRWKTIEKLRLRKRDEAAQALEQVHLAIQMLRDQAAEIQRDREQSRNNRQQLQTGQIHVANILETQRFDLVLDAQLAQLEDQSQKIEQERVRRESKLIAAQQDLEAVRKLQKKTADRNYATSLLKAQSELDNWSTLRHTLDSHSHSQNTE
jgi:flagellar export protein FliJ